jgi:hypothetical protein
LLEEQIPMSAHRFPAASEKGHEFLRNRLRSTTRSFLPELATGPGFGLCHDDTREAQRSRGWWTAVATRRNVLKSLAVLVVPGLLVSCGKKELTLPVHPVSGQIIFEGKPAVGAMVVLHRVSEPLPPDVSPVATTGADGGFQISTYQAGDGAPAGDYVATVEWRKVVGQGGSSAPGPNVIPAKYGKRDSSPLKVTISDSSNVLEPFQIGK